jgi:hypothetical protein
MLTAAALQPNSEKKLEALKAGFIVGLMIIGIYVKFIKRS